MDQMKYSQYFKGGIKIRHLIVFIILGFVVPLPNKALAIESSIGQQADIGIEIRPVIKNYIDDLSVSEIVSIQHTTDGIEENKKRYPNEPKVFPAGRYKVMFIRNGDKSAMIFQTEEKIQHLLPVMPGKSDAGGFVEILIDPLSVQNDGASKITLDREQGKELSSIGDLKLNGPELDYLIRMLYRKFEKPLTESQAMSLNLVKDYALAIKFSGKDGLDEYHKNLLRELR